MPARAAGRPTFARDRIATAPTNPMAHHHLPIVNNQTGKRREAATTPAIDAHSGTQPKGTGPGGRSFRFRPLASGCLDSSSPTASGGDSLYALYMLARTIICFDCVPSVILLQDAGLFARSTWLLSHTGLECGAIHYVLSLNDRTRSPQPHSHIHGAIQTNSILSWCSVLYSGLHWKRESVCV